MAYYAGQSITDSVIVMYGVTPVTGSPATVFTQAKAYRPDNTFTTPSIVEIGNGLYEVTFSTVQTQPGEYVIDLLDLNGVRYLATYDVDPYFTGGNTNTAISRADLRVIVGEMLRDHLSLTAQDGSTTTLTDSIGLLDSENAYLGAEGIMVGGTAQNLGRIVRVESSSQAAHTISFQPELPAPVAAGDTMHLYNLGGYGFRVQHYNTEINAAIRMAYPDFVLPILVELPLASGSGAIDLPAYFCAIYGVEAYDGAEWRQMPRSRRVGRYGSGWTVDRENRDLRIDGDWRFATGPYRIRGYLRQVEPTQDSDLIGIDVSWITYQVASMLAARRNSDPQWNNWAVEWGRQAQEMRMRMATSKSANTVWL